jgi:uncharacterized membrane protein YgdD (TMEM256/DUF423 family)
MVRVFAVTGALAALLGVALGAFGAHALSSRLEPRDLATFEIGVRYQMYHALGLLAVAWAATRWPTGPIYVAGWAFLVGILVFSGSLYLLVLTNTRWLGAVTPLGGAAFLVGWAAFAWAALRG